MAFKLSTALRNAMLSGSSFKEALANGVIRIYGGTVPATADAALGGATLLCEVSDDGSGDPLLLGTPASGSITKDGAQAWSGTNLASGTATFFRYVDTSDTGVSSTTLNRLQGTCGTSGADMNMTSTSLASGATQTVDAASFTLPTY